MGSCVGSCPNTTLSPMPEKTGKMGKSEESTLFIPSSQVEKKMKPRKQNALKTLVFAGAVVGLLAWTAWVSLTIHKGSGDQGALLLKQVEELFEKNTSVATLEDREPRALVDWLAGGELLCKSVAWTRRAFKYVGLSWDAGLERQVAEQMKKRDGLNNEILDLKDKFYEKKEELSYNYKIFSHTVSNVESWERSAELIKATNETYQAELAVDPTLQLIVNRTVNETFQQLRFSPEVSPLAGITEFVELGSQAMGFLWMVKDVDLSEGLSEMLKPIWRKGIDAVVGGLKWLNIISKEKKAAWDAELDNLQSLWHIFETATCAWNQLQYRSKLRAEIEKIKEEVKKAEEAKTELENLVERTKNAADQLFIDTERLVNYVNQYFETYNMSCKSTVATIDTDAEEINDSWQVITKLFRLEHAAIAKMVTLENLDRDLGGLLNEEGKKVYAKRQLKELEGLYPTLDPTKIVKAMEVAGFNLPHELWTKWNKRADDETCRCDGEVKNECWETWTRTCTSLLESTKKPRCAGKSKGRFNKCKQDYDGSFITRCQNRDETFIGQCKEARGTQMVLSGETTALSSPLPANRPATFTVRRLTEENESVDHGQCYQACKKEPGASGCQFNRDICPLMQTCVGSCYSVTGDIQGEDIRGSMKTTCYIFKSVNDGTASNVLNEVFSNTQEMFKDATFDEDIVAAWKKSMSEINVDLVESQENGWKEMIKYQSSTSDRWGGNPSM